MTLGKAELIDATLRSRHRVPVAFACAAARIDCAKFTPAIEAIAKLFSPCIEIGAQLAAVLATRLVSSDEMIRENKFGSIAEYSAILASLSPAAFANSSN